MKIFGGRSRRDSRPRYGSNFPEREEREESQSSELQESFDKEKKADGPETSAPIQRSEETKHGWSGKTKGVLLLVGAVCLFLGSVVMCLSILLGKTVVAASTDRSKAPKNTKVVMETDAQTGEEIEIEVPTAEDSGIFNVLIVGTDGDGTRTDTILVANLNTKTKAVSLMSIPRDTYITGGYAIPKMNSVYGAAGQGERGIRALEEKIEETLGFLVDYYIIVDLEAFEKTVDLVGGVEFDVPMDMHYVDETQNLYINLSAGRQLLDGAHAIQLCRYRSGYATADIRRTEVQQEFLCALASKFMETASLAKIKEYAGIFYDYVNTDLTIGNMIYFGQQLMGCDFENMFTATLPGEGITVKGGSYYQLWPNKTLEIINAHFNPKEEPLTIYDLNIREATSGSGEGTYTPPRTDTPTPPPADEPDRPTTRPTDKPPVSEDPTDPPEPPETDTPTDDPEPSEPPTDKPSEEPTDPPIEEPTDPPETVEEPVDEPDEP